MSTLEPPSAHGPAVPEPDREAEPAGFVVETESHAQRVHFLDWGGPEGSAATRFLLLHGLAQTAWSWAPVARRLRRVGRVVAMDLRGHGLSDAPTAGYEPAALAEDVVAVLEGAGFLGEGSPPILAGHGFGAIVAAWAAASLDRGSHAPQPHAPPPVGGLSNGSRPLRRLVLVDGGIENLAAATGADAGEWLRGVGDPPEVLRSMRSFLADRRGYDPATWDPDQERAARATVVEVPAGHLVPAIHPHALEGSVRAMFEYRPLETLAAVAVPVVAILAGPDTPARTEALGEAQLARERAGLPRIAVRRLPDAGHNVMRYRPAEVAAILLGEETAAS